MSDQRPGENDPLERPDRGHLLRRLRPVPRDRQPGPCRDNGRARPRRNAPRDHRSEQTHVGRRTHPRLTEPARLTSAATETHRRTSTARPSTSTLTAGRPPPDHADNHPVHEMREPRRAMPSKNDRLRVRQGIPRRGNADRQATLVAEAVHTSVRTRLSPANDQNGGTARFLLEPGLVADEDRILGPLHNLQDLRGPRAALSVGHHYPPVHESRRKQTRGAVLSAPGAVRQLDRTPAYQAGLGPLTLRIVDGRGGLLDQHANRCTFLNIFDNPENRPVGKRPSHNYLGDQGGLRTENGSIDREIRRDPGGTNTTPGRVSVRHASLSADAIRTPQHAHDREVLPRRAER